MCNRMIALLVLVSPLVVSCSNAALSAQTPPVQPPVQQCDAKAAQGRIGATATAQLGAELLRLTGARTLRWVPPETAVTMDYRPDRLTVSYDRGMKITSISCN